MTTKQPKRPTKRQIALANIRCEAYCTTEFAARFYIENRISYKAANEAASAGLAARRRDIESGVFPNVSTQVDRQRALASLTPEQRESLAASRESLAAPDFPKIAGR